MWTYLLLCGAVAGFLGSISPGPVNTNVVLNVLTGDDVNAQRIAFSGSLIQGLGALLVIFLTSQTSLVIPQIRHEFFSIIFVMLGIYHIILLYKIKKTNNDAPSSNGYNKGIFLAILNPQILPFWLFVIGYLTLDAMSVHIAGILAFSVGAFAGTYAILWVYIRLSKRTNAHLSPCIINKSLATLFIILGIINIF